MRIVSTFVAFALATSAAFAADATPLAPGAPAGVKRAQSADNTVLFSVLGAGAVAFIALVISQGGSTTLSPTVNQSTTTSTGTAS